MKHLSAMQMNWLKLKYWVPVAVFYCVSASCHTESNTVFTPAQAVTVRDSAMGLMHSIENNITHYGPIAWLRYFENTPAFFMASDGAIAFANNDSATNFIQKTLVKNISQIKLQWNDIRIDALTPALAGVAAGFHETLTSSSGKAMAADGYFTGIAERSPQGWQLRNLHWSLKASK